MTESRALESANRPSGNQALVVAAWRRSGPAAALTLDRRCRDQSEESRARTATPYHRSPGVDGVPLPVGVVRKLPHYSSIGGSFNVAGAPVATASPGEFVPVWSRTAGCLLGLTLPLMSKFPLLVVHGLGRVLEYYLGCVFS